MALLCSEAIFRLCFWATVPDALQAVPAELQCLCQSSDWHWDQGISQGWWHRRWRQDRSWWWDDKLANHSAEAILFIIFLVNVKNLIKTLNTDWKMSAVSPLQSLPAWLSNKWLSWPTSYFTTPTFNITRGTTWAITCFSSFCLSLTSPLQVSSQLLYRQAHRPDPHPLRLWPLLSVMNVPDWN